MKKIICALIAIATVISMSACSSIETSEASDTTASSEIISDTVNDLREDSEEKQAMVEATTIADTVSTPTVESTTKKAKKEKSTSKSEQTNVTATNKDSRKSEERIIIAAEETTVKAKTETIDVHQIYRDYISSPAGQQYFKCNDGINDDHEFNFIDIDDDGIDELFFATHFTLNYYFVEECWIVNMFDIDGEAVRHIFTSDYIYDSRLNEHFRIARLDDGSYNIIRFTNDGSTTINGTVYTYDGEKLAVKGSISGYVYGEISKIDRTEYRVSYSADLYDDLGNPNGTLDSTSKDDFHEVWDSFYDGQTVISYGFSER